MHNQVGWYVDDAFFDNKVKALEHCDWQPEKIKFHYKNEQLANYDFSIEPKQSWNELLLSSCLRLRDSADHISLWFSGGGDSSTILKTFAENNIRLDELIFYDRVYKVYDYWETESAYTKKQMQEFRKLQPHCKLTVLNIDYDNAEDFYKKFKDQWIYQPYANIRFSKNLRWHFIDRHVDLKKSIDKGNRIDIFGRDKPKCILWDDKWWLTFFDSFEYDTYHAGFHHFYWDDLDILCKQAHMAINFFETDNDPESFCHRVQKNTPGPVYLEYCRAIGRDIPIDDFIAQGWNKGSNNPAAPGYESAKILSHAKTTAKEIYQHYTGGFEYIKSKFDMGNQQEFIGNILGEKYMLRPVRSK